jgi:hypothetical protein
MLMRSDIGVRTDADSSQMEKTNGTKRNADVGG